MSTDQPPLLSGPRVIPRCRWCLRRVRIRATGTATAHKVQGVRCPGSGQLMNLNATTERSTR
ncbi:hypothetical protein [Nocardiopsis sp. FR26]|uniref:hypothetical protein n=1 Tax=Nocardiopsis sp. FR26 TaxID=2605987 RepID=UPI001359FDE3|nr:hypothetical protein [Nocardiopsis sp. FR26]